MESRTNASLQDAIRITIEMETAWTAIKTLLGRRNLQKPADDTLLQQAKELLSTYLSNLPGWQTRLAAANTNMQTHAASLPAGQKEIFLQQQQHYQERQARLQQDLSVVSAQLQSLQQTTHPQAAASRFRFAKEESKTDESLFTPSSLTKNGSPSHN